MVAVSRSSCSHWLFQTKTFVFRPMKCFVLNFSPRFFTLWRSIDTDYCRLPCKAIQIAEKLKARKISGCNSSLQESCELFTVLYKSWCHNAVATFSLCLLTQTYHHGCDLLMTLYPFETARIDLISVL